MIALIDYRWLDKRLGIDRYQTEDEYYDFVEKVGQLVDGCMELEDARELAYREVIK